MSANTIHGISLYGTVLNENNLAFTEKMNKFGYAVVLDEIGNDKLSKAILGIYDVLQSEANPNILIITSEKLKYNWYSELVTNLGADFKFTSSFGSVGIITKQMPNLYIMSDKELGQSQNRFMENAVATGVVWDLIIIDCGLSRSGINPSMYIDNLNCKTKKLAIFAESLKNDIKALEILRAVPRALLENYNDLSFSIDENIVKFSLKTPYMRYYEKDESKSVAPEIKVVSYTLPKHLVAQHNELQKLPAYMYGGNIFEELTLDTRKQYVLTRYNEDIVAQLEEADTKLSAFLKTLAEIMKDLESCTAVYFSAKSTMNYVAKVLEAKYLNTKHFVKLLRNDVCDIEGTLSAFTVNKKTPPRIILCDDGLPEKIKDVEKITHIINYELPKTPVLFRQRYGRTGRRKVEAPELIVFNDTDGKFDGRALNSVLPFNFLDAVVAKIPSKTIFSFAPGLADSICNVICELNKASTLPDNTETKSAIFALELKYNLGNNDYGAFIQIVKDKLYAFKNAFEIQSLDDSAAIKASVNAKLNEIRDAYAYLDDNGAIKTVSALTDDNEELVAFRSKLSGNKYIVQLNEAEKLIDSRMTESGDYEFFSDMLDGRTDINSAALFNTWRYWNDKAGVSEDYREFIKLVNEGVI